MSTVHQPPATAPQRYAQAHALHYEGRDLLHALQAYGQILESHPGAVEAGYARSQIRNIVQLVVPEAELLKSQTALALGRLQRDADRAVKAGPD